MFLAFVFSVQLWGAQWKPRRTQHNSMVWIFNMERGPDLWLDLRFTDEMCLPLPTVPWKILGSAPKFRFSQLKFNPHLFWQREKVIKSKFWTGIVEIHGAPFLPCWEPLRSAHNIWHVAMCEVHCYMLSSVRYGPVTNGARHAPAVVTTYHHLDAAVEALYANKHILPSGKLSHNYGKSPFLMGKSTTTCHFQ